MCECHQIGGPFIAEDPECPAHGYEAQAAQREREQTEAAQAARITALEDQVADLKEQVRELMTDRPPRSW